MTADAPWWFPGAPCWKSSAENAKQPWANLCVPGTDVRGTVASLNRHGVVVDIGGIDGFIHISELSHKRVERAEDVVNVGDQVEVRVIGVERNEKGVRVRLSMKARVDAPDAPAAPAPDEVLTATVLRTASSGVVVSTPKGEGLIPLRELGLPTGGDHRRAYPVGKTFDVVVFDRDGRGRTRFSAVGVARVEERRNVKEFASSQQGLGSLGDLLREKLGLPEPPPEPATRPEPALTKARPSPPEVDSPQVSSPSVAEAKIVSDATSSGPPSSRRPDPPGVVRRKR